MADKAEEKPRYIDNVTTPLRKVDNPKEQLVHVLADLVTTSPPTAEYNDPKQLLGVAVGPTSAAYLFFRISILQPNLQINGKTCRDWALEYMSSKRTSLEGEKTAAKSGVISERIGVPTMEAVLHKDLEKVKELVRLVDEIPRHGNGPEPSGTINDWCWGRAGLLWTLRMARRFVPGADELLARPIRETIEDAIKFGLRMKCYGTYFLGPGHGLVGILTQIVLTEPSYAPQVEGDLIKLLDYQREDGNWPPEEDKDDTQLVQFCHGAPGFVICLKAIRPHFPNLQERIDTAIKRGEEVVWKRGILTKVPNMCHGTTGNAFALDKGEKRSHFLAYTTKAEQEKGEAAGWLARADYGVAVSFLFGRAGQAWGWADEMSAEDLGFVFYTDA
ncbi:hypothetical protein MMC25_003260 [Agyrium rufum]|nr:hypothetical protein [Agyrium rufum]